MDDKTDAKQEPKPGGWKEVIINGVRVDTIDVREFSREWWKKVAPPSKEKLAAERKGV